MEKDQDVLIEQPTIQIKQSADKVVSHIYTCIYIYSVIRLPEHFLKVHRGSDNRGSTV